MAATVVPEAFIDVRAVFAVSLIAISAAAAVGASTVGTFSIFVTAAVELEAFVNIFAETGPIAHASPA